MAITINWGTKIVSVPKADTTLVQASPEIRSLDIDVFRLRLKDLEDDEAGMSNLNTHNHNTTVTVAGVTLARVVEIINSYTVTFEDGQYAVNLVGANSNISDVTNVNQVSIRSANSAGLIVSGSGVTAQDKLDIASQVWSKVIETLSAEEMMRVMLAAMAGKRAGLGTATEQYMGRDGVTPRITLAPTDAAGNGTPTINGAA